jgi:hypothetical protein
VGYEMCSGLSFGGIFCKACSMHAGEDLNNPLQECLQGILGAWVGVGDLLGLAFPFLVSIAG